MTSMGATEEGGLFGFTHPYKGSPNPGLPRSQGPCLTVFGWILGPKHHYQMWYGSREVGSNPDGKGRSSLDQELAWGLSIPAHSRRAFRDTP